MQAQNMYQVFTWLWTSGQLSEQDIHTLPSLGVCNVINIALPTSTPSLPNEAEIVTRLGINYFHIPVTWEHPEAEKLECFIKLLASLTGENTWVHCAANFRVSAFIYLFRKMHLKESDESAKFPMEKIWQPNEIWAEFIAQALQSR